MRFPSERVSSLREAFELLGVWIACIWGIFLSSTSYAMLKWKIKREFSVETEQVRGLQRLSVIITAYNEVNCIRQCIELVDKHTSNQNKTELIVVDASSTDGTAEALRNLMKEINFRFIQSPSGRGISMNKGAEAATGDSLLFLHADTKVPFGYDELIRIKLAQPHVIAAAFRFKVDRKPLNGQNLIGLNTMEVFANFRALNFQLPYGDQAISITKDMYKSIGGFPDVKIMEDFELIGKLRRRALGQGRQIAIIPAEAECSPRRWMKNGVLKNTLMNQVIVIAYVYLGWSPDRIYSVYYRS